MCAPRSYGMEISLRLDCTSDQASISRWSAAKGCSQVCWRFDQAASLPVGAARAGMRAHLGSWVTARTSRAPR